MKRISHKVRLRYVTERSSANDDAGLRGAQFGIHPVRARSRRRQYQLVGVTFHDDVSTHRQVIFNTARVKISACYGILFRGGRVTRILNAR